MNKYADSEADIHKRIHKFIVSCFINVVRKIPKKTENLVIIKQISASLTSIGANDQEANASETNRDFIAKYTIVKKETNETLYWLNLIVDLEIIDKKSTELYLVELSEILLIVSKIILNSRKKL